MSKRTKGISILAAALLILAAATAAAAQTTTTTVTVPQTPTTTITQTPTTVTKTVQNPDGSYTVIEYPVKKETIVNLNPVTITNAKGVATILRDDNGTRVVVNMTGVPADVSAINLYAVDDTGAVTSLGPVVLSNGTGKFTATTPLSKFMLIAAPDESLTAYDPNAKVYFRSAVPEGFAVIPHTTSAGRRNSRRDHDAGNHSRDHHHRADVEYPGLQERRRDKNQSKLHRRHDRRARERVHRTAQERPGN